MFLVLIRKLTAGLGFRPASEAESAKTGAGRERLFSTLQAFGGSCLLTAALLLPHVKPLPVFAGIILAALIRWGWSTRHH